MDERQASLTDRYLTGRTGALYDYFLALRAEIDRALSTHLPPAGAKPYPYGRCEEITRESFAVLSRRLERPGGAVEDGLRAFVLGGGTIRTIWGVLRGRYFQNALQIGGLYVDVSNDTVVVTKPKIEILPIGECGMESVRDLDHFREIAASYWGATLYANHMVPTLAPLLPIFSVSPGRLLPGLQSACDYMIALMGRDRFRQAESWLDSAPPPPEELTRAFLNIAPADLHPLTDRWQAEAVLACRRARSATCWNDPRWRDARVLDFLRIRPDAGAAG